MDWSVTGGFIIIGLIIIFYLLPTFIAHQRGAGHQGAIFAINLFFGWTVLGWIAALIWAIVEAPKAEPVSQRAETARPPVDPDGLPHESGRLLGG